MEDYKRAHRWAAAGEAAPQGLKPSFLRASMSELKLRPPKRQFVRRARVGDAVENRKQKRKGRLGDKPPLLNPLEPYWFVRRAP